MYNKQQIENLMLNEECHIDKHNSSCECVQMQIVDLHTWVTESINALLNLDIRQYYVYLCDIQTQNHLGQLK